MNNAASIPDLSKFDELFNSWLAACQARVDKHWKVTGLTYAMSPRLHAERGPRFIKIVNIHRDTDGSEHPEKGNSVYAFIDTKGGKIAGTDHKIGDVLKPASWKTPAKHARGNIFAADNGQNCMGHYGPAYLR